MDQERRPGRVTSVDVAQAAGVSQTSVSLVFTGRADGRLSRKTQQLIEDAADRLGYVPNAWARVLRGGLPQVLGLAVPNIENRYFSSVFLGAERVARQYDMAVLLIDTAHDPKWIVRTIQMSQTKLFAGAIIYAEMAEAAAQLTDAIDHLVFVEGPGNVRNPVVDIDIADGMRQVAEHLTGLGHVRIGHARADYPSGTFKLRARHFTDALSDLGCSPSRSWHYSSSFDCDEATRRAVDFLTSTDVTALFCDDDLLAAGVYRACARLGRSIPDDLSVVGFNGTDLTRYLTPELTSVTIPAAQVGEQAAQALIEHMKEDTITTAVLPLALTTRASTAAPRHGRGG